ncbi:MAG: tetratricopeptide repeat protein, partial [Cyclobacteriaceae bacterium]|nr:tetratricopeptide repeat protein [Cyclobacteriaceae bacterium]
MVTNRVITIVCLMAFQCYGGSAQHYRLYRMLKKENFSRAITFGEEKLKKAKVERERGRMKLLLTLGKLYELRGNFTKAEALYLQALDQVKLKMTAGEKLWLSDFNVIDEISLFYVHTGNFTEAEKWTDYSLQHRVGHYNKRDPVNFRPYISKGLLFFYRDEWDSAAFYLTAYQKNIRNSNYTGNLEVNRYADTYQVLAELELKRGNLQKAFKNAKKTVRLQKHEWTRREAGKNTLKRVKALNTLSTIFQYKEQWNKSEKYLTMAVKLYDKNIRVDFPEKAELYLSRAWQAWHVGEIDSVIALVKKAVSIELDYIHGSFSTLSEYEKENFQIRHKALF